MKRTLPILIFRLFICAISAFPGLLSAQVNVLQHAAFLIPQEMKDHAHQVVRAEYISFKLKDPKEGILSVKKTVTLLDQRNTEDELVLFYDKDTKVNSLSVNVYDAFGQHVRKIGLKDKEVEDLAAIDGFSIYNDSRVKRLKVAHTSFPFTIEYEYELTLRGLQLAVFPDWELQGFHTSVQQSRFEVELPANVNLLYKPLNIKLELQELKTTQGKKAFAWEVRDLPAIPHEPYAPSPAAVLPRIIYSSDQFQIDTYFGSMADWKSFGAFVYSLYQGRDALPADIKAEVQRIVAESPDDVSKIHALYRFMQRDMRYVSVQTGIGGWQPFDATYVAENKYGDCKALSNYMKALLQEAGIEAWPVLIKNGNLDYDVTEDFATSHFNHAILYVPKNDIWLECTSSDMPPNYIGADNSDRNVLLITPQGGVLKRTPVQTADMNQAVNSVSVEIRPEGGAALAYSRKAQGEPHELLRYLHRHVSKEEQEKWLMKKNPLPTLKILHFETSAETDAPAAGLQYRAELGQLGARTGKRWFVPVNLLNAFNEVPAAATESRRLPVVLTQHHSETDTIRFVLPDNYVLESYPQQLIEIQSDFGYYSLQFERSDNGLTATRTLRLQPVRAAAERYSEFRNFFRDIAKNDALKLVLKQKE
jgi:transglutaminase-like putative cysteine protease